MDDCTSCKRYKESLEKNKIITCYKAEYYTYGMIFFCRPQMFFLIKHLDMLSDGYWPPNPDGSSYTELLSLVVPKPDAYFAKPSGIAGEVEYRLEKTKRDGETLVHEIQELGVDLFEKLAPDAKSALNYISGFRRRKRSYEMWKADRNYDKNIIYPNKKPQYMGKKT